MAIGDWVCYEEDKVGEVVALSVNGKNIFVRDGVSHKCVEIEARYVRLLQREAAA